MKDARWYLEVTPLLRFFVPGYPVPKGSVMPFVTAGGKAIAASNKELDTWCTLLSYYAKAAMREAGGLRPLDGPLEVEMVFIMPRARGKGAASTHVLADVAPDADKLARAAGDALQGIVYTNDGRIVDIVSRKRWQVPGSPTGVHVYVAALAVPGAQGSLLEV